jgi:hypothetical protein
MHDAQFKSSALDHSATTDVSCDALPTISIIYFTFFALFIAHALSQGTQNNNDLNSDEAALQRDV